MLQPSQPRSPFKAIFTCAYEPCSKLFVAYRRSHAAGVMLHCSRSCAAKSRVARQDAERAAA